MTRIGFHLNHKNRSLPTEGEEIRLFQELRDEMREAQTRTPRPAKGATVSRTLGGRGSSVQRLLGHGEPRLVPGVGVISWGGKEWEEWLGRGLKGQQWAEGKTSGQRWSLRVHVRLTSRSVMSNSFRLHGL